MSEILSESWLAETREMAEQLPALSGVDARVQYTVTGGPDGKLLIGVVVGGGVVAEIEMGKLPDPDCKVSLSYETCIDILDGSVSPEVAFMRGGLKVEGDHALWLVELSALRRQVADRCRSRMER